MSLPLKRWAVRLVCSILLLSALPFPPSVVQASATLRASLPPFPVKLNGVELDLAHSRHPFLFMNDMTYMPLTWNNLRSLNVKFEWSEEEGLKIWPNLDSPPPIQDGPPGQDLWDKPNPTVLSVKRADESLQIAGTSIDNAAEAYPFISFRDVFYVPLTWRYAHDLLHLDIRWDQEGGLQIIGGQNLIGSVAGEDDYAIYFYSRLADPVKAILRMEKGTFQMSWQSRESAAPLLEQTRTAVPPHGGKPAAVTRKDRSLYYKDLLLYTLTDSDVWEAADFGPPVHTYTEYEAGQQGTIVTVNLTLPLPVIGPNHGTTYNFLVRDGKVSRLDDFTTRLNQVIPNPDGTVWIAADRLSSRHGYAGGTARIALMDREGRLQLVNESYNESDVMALGLGNPNLPNPAGPDGSLYVVMFGRTRDWKEQDTAGLYTLNTRLETTRLTHSVDGEYYMDQNRSLYLLKRNNTIENVAAHEIRSWFDYELAGMESR